MLITLLAWMYISFLCHAWGVLSIKILSKIAGNQARHAYGFSITCLVGLAAIAAVAQVISLCTGLSSLPIQVLFFIPAVYVLFLYEKPRLFLHKLRSLIQNTHAAVIFLFAAALLMVLVMGVYSISHPDTIAYHAQSIKWAERYRVIPGLVHINYLYGLQNSWFLLCGLFSFSFTGTNALTFINTTVLVWLLIFLAQKINASIRKPVNAYVAFLWLLLLFIHIWTYTQIRLTATSASPDFIATIYILLIVFLCMQYRPAAENLPLITFLCFFTFTIKLSALPLILLVVYLQYPFNRTKFFSGVLMAIVIIVPFLIRNAITSGYLLYPLAFPDIINANWKYNSQHLDFINKYITAFARTRNDLAAANQPFGSWIQTWWQLLYLADKLVIAVQFFAIILFISNYWKITAANKMRRSLIFISLSGVLFWFWKAPDPRFGAGFLLSFPALVVCSEPFIKKTASLFQPRRMVILLSMLLGTAISCYTMYRLFYYFKPTELVSPEGIILPYKSTCYHEINTCIPLINNGNKNVLIVSDTAPNRHFDFRGTTVEQGFKATEHK